MEQFSVDLSPVVEIHSLPLSLTAEPEAKQSINEQIIPYKGKNSLRQYLP